MGLGLVIRSVRLLSPMVPGSMDLICYTLGDAAEVWKAIPH